MKKEEEDDRLRHTDNVTVRTKMKESGSMEIISPN